MEMKLANRESKSILAKLLASENLTVEHGKFNTASFDVKNRVLRLPIWKEMSGSLYDLLVLHEVGHALYTPEEGYHDAKGYGAGFKSFLNVVEDARIERKIKTKFPGGRRAFVEGYENLMERDFFGIKENHLDVNTLNLIDRINLHYKAGSHLNIAFNEEESGFLNRIDKAETWKTVVEICKDLYEYAKDHDSETDMSDHSMSEMMNEQDEMDAYEDYDPSDYEEMEMPEENDEEKASTSSEKSNEESEEDSGSKGKSEEENDEEGEKENSPSAGAEGGTDGDFDPDYEPESETDRNFRNNENELVSEEAKPYKYLNIPTDINLDHVVVSFNEIYSEYKKEMTNYGNFDDQYKICSEKFKEFRGKNKKVVEYLAKEFEMKKAAREHQRAATANSGIIDSEKLHTYKYNEHIFKKLTVLPNGKNHGLMMFVDWSGSMSGNMKGTIEQMMVLVMFCKRVNIPFEVYAFSDSYSRYEENSVVFDSNGCFVTNKTPGDMTVRRFNLLNLFSSRMRANQIHDAYIYMMATTFHFTNRYSWSRYETHITIPSRMNLGGTPLDDTLIMSFSLIRDFIRKNQIDVINSIFLTDGDSHTSHTYWKVPETKTYDDGTSREDRLGHFNIHDENVIVRDPISKKSMLVGGNSRRRRRNMTCTLVKLLREVFDINIVNFFLLPKMRKWDLLNLMDDTALALGKDNIHNDGDVDQEMKKFRKDKYYVSPELNGFTEQYSILGGKHLEVEEEKLEVAEDATVAQLARAFKKFSGGKLQQRKLLSRFIDMVAV